MNDDKITENLRVLISKNPDLHEVLTKLNANNIRYGLYAGVHVAILTDNRIPTDIDLLVYDDDIAKLKTLFPNAKVKDDGKGVFLYIDDDELIEFMSSADVVQEDKIFPFRLTDAAVDRIITYEVGEDKIKLVDPVDSILLKSILQRGADQGKHDLEDIEAVVETIDIDTSYLRRRLEEAHALEKARPVFSKLGINL